MSALGGLRSELQVKVATINQLLAAGDPLSAPNPIDISRETRGMVIVLMYAAYEWLLTSVCKTVLDEAQSQGLSNTNLKPGFRLFAVSDLLVGMTMVSQHKIWSERGQELMARLDSPMSTIPATVFPKDGSNMKCGQLATLCALFDLPHPGQVLNTVWNRIDIVVVERNGIAHGSLSPADVGSRYSSQEIRDQVAAWFAAWDAFVVDIDARLGPAFFKR